ncbi:hypothetical protein [Pseudobacter ginsenosidimutans]|uniref:Uncharacterized protein n=1 Tax=Pseudobacter ginsenosidimutans TaxID=661488 RepID=A0A4Q7MW58_9BACT|nr:hypothetical protein [Pseudobacter ginsenosidimutans]RZS72279.1 hypothetical protein EV199_4195 [Pseudobacter ginsenosidimutans]
MLLLLMAGIFMQMKPVTPEPGDPESVKKVRWSPSCNAPGASTKIAILCLPE